MTQLSRARMVRNGLMIALFAHYPIRLKNYAALSIGGSLVKIDRVWWIILTAAETKEKKADERPIEDYLGDLIDKYLETYRPILARGKDAGSALWLAETGTPMAECFVREVITETTRATLGVPSIRTCFERRARPRRRFTPETNPISAVRSSITLIMS